MKVTFNVTALLILKDTDLIQQLDDCMGEIMSDTDDSPRTTSNWTILTKIDIRSFTNIGYSFEVFETEKGQNSYGSFSVSYDTGIAVGCAMTGYQFNTKTENLSESEEKELIHSLLDVDPQIHSDNLHSTQ